MVGRDVMWFAAHVIMLFKFTRPEDQTSFPMWENIFLIEAPDSRKAWDKAVGLGRADESDGSDGLRWDEKPARLVFAGVRKIVECRSDADDRPVDGAEITYSQLSVRSEDDLRKLVDGEYVTVQYEE